MDAIRQIVHFQGDVQGVGFRYTTCRAADGYDVSGEVRNLPDGRVEVIAEGAEDQVLAFLDEVRRRMAGYIRGEKTKSAEPTGLYAGFSVAY